MLFSEPIPKKIISWQLKGDGLKEFGNNSNPDELPFPKFITVFKPLSVNKNPKSSQIFCLYSLL